MMNDEDYSQSRDWRELWAVGGRGEEEGGIDLFTYLIFKEYST
jgi:hypothetical protein